MSDAIDQRELTYLALAGLAGGALGWIPVELVSHGHTITQVENTWTQIAGVVSMALFWGLVGGLIVAAQGKSLQVTPAATRRVTVPGRAPVGGTRVQQEAVSVWPHTSVSTPPMW